ncbi:cytochrome P450 [Emericellopsis atlantica]|uniref:Cytochrome P450 n=1 Tax=Emericellopsis atlantica TaxID=2614577 RepID=A0A9P7ZNY8_9HYPO|nr:cytochrome P450 [Emericellopsis atlantica]KAG9255171.1 cytochrome P450 [Emericellopsis atlantica]
MLLTSPTVVASIALLTVAVLVYRTVKSPLWKVPGPTVSAFTSLILKWHELGADRTLYIQALHLQYGPVVRIAPNEVSFTSWAALKEIYCSGGSGYEKTEFYDLFTIFGRRTMFTTLGKTDHAKRKRILADRYANSNVMRGSAIAGIQERSKRFIARCTAGGLAAHDVFCRAYQVALHAYACDCVTHHLFHPEGTDSLRDVHDEEMMHQVAADDSFQNRLVSFYAPTLHRLASGILNFWWKPRETPLVEQYVQQTSKQAEAEPFTLLSRLREKTGDLDEVDTAAECLDHIAAGIDTTGDGLCFLMWELSQPRSRDIQQRLQAELRASPDAPLDQLPYLDAVVLEGLRCFPPIPMSLPRYVPSGGRVIDGTWLPAKTIVSCQAYSVHRLNPSVFPAAHIFNPSRWLDEDGDADRRRLMFAFSNGGRGCIGKHLALAEMKTLLRDTYSAYTTTPHASMSEESMAMADQLISSRPRDQKCLLHFEPLDSSSVAGLEH